MILPLTVLGSSSTKITRLGFLKPASRSRAVAMISASVAVMSGPQDDDGGDVLAPHRIGQTDDRRLRDRRMGVQHLFDLAAVHVLAAGDDHVLHPVDDVEEALLVTAGHVAGVEPAALERLGGALLVAEVALQHLLAADHDLADDAGRALVHVLVDDLHVGEAHRRAARREQVLLAVDRPLVGRLREREHVAAQLGHPEAGVHDRTEALDRRPQHLDRHRGRAVADAAQRVELVVVDLRVLQHHVEHRRRQRGAGDAVLVDELHPQLGLEHRGQHDATAAHVGDGHGVAGDVAQRERHQVPLVGLRLVLDHRLQHGHGEVAVGEHRALGEPGRAARVQQPGGRVLVDVAWRLVGRRGADDVGVARVAAVLAAADHDRRAARRRCRPSRGSIVLEVLLLDDQHAWPRRC